MPSAISVNMLSLRSSGATRSRARRTASRTTARLGSRAASSSQLRRRADRKGSRSTPKTWLAMASTTSGTESGTPTISRRVKSTSSGLSVHRPAARPSARAPCRRSGRTRALLHDLGMHRAGVERALRQRLGVAALGQIALGIAGEFRPASFRAEMNLWPAWVAVPAGLPMSTFIPQTGSVAIVSLGVIFVHRVLELSRGACGPACCILAYAAVRGLGWAAMECA